MKQEIISYLSTLKTELYDTANYIYNNPEESFKEYNCYNYIINMLKKHNFNVEENYLQIPTSFYAQMGSGHPKICYLCEYDGDPEQGHVSGHNLVTTMSLGAAIGLSKVLPKLGGTLVVIGCPGQYINGSKTTMVKQGTFKDIDAVLVAHPNVTTTKTLKSYALIPAKVKFSIPKDKNYLLSSCNPSHCGTLTYSFTNFLKENLPKDYDIKAINWRGSCNPYTFTSEYEIDYLINSMTLDKGDKILNFIKSFVNCIGDIFSVDTDVSIYGIPYEEMHPNETLCRVFSHNLKESGIIYVKDFPKIMPGLSLGSVSHVVPCINPFIKITEDTKITYPSKEFALETIKEFSLEQCMKACTALAITGLDLIENKDLLSQIKEEQWESAK
ncbi:amidohydrolase [Haloimpatiens massiliensis]|uniref:amidohydrolase n=1 Tax=Haloimpatiens massiliensis TaxID=1658110 RepID=UPI000C825344|nr:amidohydrolase [Haloimpatiens massiliensis]